MKLNTKSDRPHLNVLEKDISGLINSEREGYFGCKYIFEPFHEELSINDLFEISAEEFIDDVCINASFNSQFYDYFFVARIGRREDIMNFEVVASYELEEWNEDINLRKFLPKLAKTLEEDGRYDVDCSLDGDANFIILKFERTNDSSISILLDEVSKYLHKKHYLVLNNNDIEEQFISQFNFPSEYKSAFVQYLTYFGKFLEDLGINGDISINNKEEYTSIGFLPSNKDVALDNIASALNAYLSLPSTDVLSIVECSRDLESEVRMQQLVSAIDHLKSQLNLSKAVESLKNREISLLEGEISLHRETVNYPVDKSLDIKDYWEPIEGIKITSYKGKFFDINIPLLVNKAKSLRDKL